MGFRRIPEHTPTSIGHICEGSFWKKSKLQTCAGACIQAFGHICEVYSKEASGRKASFKNALVLVYKCVSFIL